MPIYRLFIIGLGLIALLLAGALIWLDVTQTQHSHQHSDMPIADFGAQAPGGDFQLLDEQGREVTRANFGDKYLLIFFGFTHCPDICPTQLAVIENALNELPAPMQAKIAPLFISVDPQRDTPQVMGDYVQRFHPSQRGLTGTPPAIARMAKDYKIHYSYRPINDNQYDVQHTTIVYLFAPDGRLLHYFTRATQYDDMARAIHHAMH